MPNHVINELTFCGLDVAETNRLVSLACNREGEVDFGVLLPVPINAWMHSSGVAHEKTFPYVALDWCAKNWSTKWGPYGGPSVVHRDDGTVITFRTAWHPPYGWLVALFNSGFSFKYAFLSEGEPRARAGFFDRMKTASEFGTPWAESESDEETHKRMHVMLWGVESFPEDDEAAHA